MKKLDEKQKTIALIVGIVVVFAIVIFRVLGSMSGGGTPPPPEVEVIAAGSGGGGAAAVAVDNKKQIAVAPIVVPPNRNPFQPAPTAPTTIKITTPSTDKQTQLRGKFGMGAQTPILPPGGFLRPDPLVMQVMGVVTGRNPVVVIRVNGKDYVVPKGVTFAKGLVIKQVTAMKVVVAQGKDLHVLEVGDGPSDGNAAAGGFAPSNLVR